VETPGLPVCPINTAMDITVAEADAYHTLRGNQDWQFFGEDAEKLAALYRASDYIRATYLFVDSEAASTLIREATIRLAPEIDSLTTFSEEAKIKSKKESLDGVLSEETVYRDDATTLDPFPLISALLAPVVRGGTSNGKGLTVARLVR